MRRRISQRDARALKKRVAELEALEARRANRWPSDYPGGTHFWTLRVEGTATAALRTANTLGHYIVAIPRGDDNLMLYAMKHGS